MANNYFLTGEKGIGKSTIINSFLEEYKGIVGGFRTIKNISENGIISFHIVNIFTSEKPNKDNFLFNRGERSKDVNKSFDKLSVVLDDYNNYDIVVMDELGPTEEDAKVFKEKVFKILDSKKIVIGVIQKAKSEFLETILKRGDVKVLEITRNNRNEIDLNKEIKF